MVGTLQTNRTSVAALEQAVQRAHANLKEQATSEAAGLRSALEREQQQTARAALARSAAKRSRTCGPPCRRVMNC